MSSRVEVGGAQTPSPTRGGHDGRRPRPLCTAVYCTADDLLPEKPGNARRSVTDAEVVTLCVAQAIMGIPSDRRFLAVARKRLVTCSRRSAWPGRLLQAPPPSGRHHRVADGRLCQPRARASTTTCCSATRRRSSAPAAVRPSSARRSATPPTTATAPATRRFFWGFRLHAIFAPDGTPRALDAGLPQTRRARGRPRAARPHPPPRRRDPDRRQGLRRASTSPQASASMDATIVRPRRKDEPGRRPTPRADPPADRVDLLDLQGHPHPRAPRRPHAPRPQRAHPATLPLPRRLPSPSTTNSAPQPRTRRLLRLNRVESII